MSHGCLGQGGCLLLLDNPAPCAGSIKGLQCPALLLLPLLRSRATPAFSSQSRSPSPRRSAPTGQPAGSRAGGSRRGGPAASGALQPLHHHCQGERLVDPCCTVQQNSWSGRTGWPLKAGVGLSCWLGTPATEVAESLPGGWISRHRAMCPLLDSPSPLHLGAERPQQPWAGCRRRPLQPPRLTLLPCASPPPASSERGRQLRTGALCIVLP